MTKIQKISDGRNYAVDRGDKLPDWVAEAFDKKSKNAVEVGRERNTQTNSITNQISDIMHGSRKRHATVESAVAEMRERTGLNKYLNELKADYKDIARKINASAEEAANQPAVLQKHPEIAFYIDNLIQTRHGNVNIHEIIANIREVYANEINSGEISIESLGKYINSKIMSAQSINNNTPDFNAGLGVGIKDEDSSNDPKNTDAFSFAIPAK